MKKKTTLIAILTIGIIIGTIIGLFIRIQPQLGVVSVSNINISFNPKETLATSYWVITCTLDQLPFTNYLLMTNDLIQSQGTYTFNGKKIGISSKINITFVPSERPYIVIPCELRNLQVTMKTYGAMQYYEPDGLISWATPNYSISVNPLIVSYLLYKGDIFYAYTPFRVIVEKDGTKLLDNVYATQYNSSGDMKSQVYEIPIPYEYPSYIKIYGQDAYRTSFIPIPIDSVYFKHGYWFMPNFDDITVSPKVSRPLIATLSDLNDKWSYNVWWFGEYRWSNGYMEFVPDPSAIGTPRPKDDYPYNAAYYNEAWVRVKPGWKDLTNIRGKPGNPPDGFCTEAEPVQPLYELSQPNDDTQAGLGFLSYIRSVIGGNGATLFNPDWVNKYPSKTERNNLIFYNMDFLGSHEVAIYIPAGLANTFVYEEPTANFDITKYYWLKTGTTDTSINSYEFDTMVITVKNLSNSTATALLDIIPDKAITDNTIISGTTSASITTEYTFNITVTNKGVLSKVTGKIDVSVKNTIGKVFRTVTFTVTLKELGGEIIIFTEGESPPNTAKMYLDGLEIQRNDAGGTRYRASISVGSHVVSFQDIPNYKKDIYVNNVLQDKSSFVTVDIVAGTTTTVKCCYSLATSTTLTVVVFEKGSLTKLSGIYVQVLTANNKKYEGLTNLNGEFNIDLGSYIGNVTVLVEPVNILDKFIYASNITSLQVALGTNTLKVELENRTMLIGLIGGGIGITGVGVGVYALKKRRQEIRY